MGLPSLPAYAGLSGVSAGAVYRAPLGFYYQTLDRGIGGQADLWVDSSFIQKDWQLHFSGGYEPYFVRGQETIKLGMLNAFAGLQMQSVPYGSTFTPFLSVEVGGVYNWLYFTGVTNYTTNSSIAFATQLVPGFDLPLSKVLGVVVEIPTRLIVFKNPMVLWGATASLRLKL